MRHPVRSAAMAAVLALSASLCIAAETKPDAAPAPAAKAGPADKAVTPNSAKAPRQKMVDINRASTKELMKLPGVTEELAGKIVAGRPYRSKADLVTRSIVPNGVYEDIKRQIIAKPK